MLPIYLKSKNKSAFMYGGTAFTFIKPLCIFRKIKFLKMALPT